MKELKAKIKKFNNKYPYLSVFIFYAVIFTTVISIEYMIHRDFKPGALYVSIFIVFLSIYDVRKKRKKK